MRWDDLDLFEKFSILNFLNCGWVICDTTCGGVTGVELRNEGAVLLLGGLGAVEVVSNSVAFKMCKIYPRPVIFFTVTNKNIM